MTTPTSMQLLNNTSHSWFFLFDALVLEHDMLFVFPSKLTSFTLYG